MTVSSSNTYYFSDTSFKDNSVLWDIYRASSGYYIKSRLTGRYLCVNQGRVVLESQLTHRAYWYFEPAASGRASYFLTANDLNSAGNDSVDGCVNNLISMGYQTERVDIPHVNQPYVTSGSNRVTVYHGHGSAGMIAIAQPDDTAHWMYSENVPSGAYKSEAVASIANKNSYIVFVSCYSAADSNDRRSLVEVAYERGAGCVTGFSGTVTGGEHYMNTVFGYMAEDNDLTLYEALDISDSAINSSRSSGNTAADPDNRVTLGNANFSLNMN